MIENCKTCQCDEFNCTIYRLLKQDQRDYYCYDKFIDLENFRCNNYISGGKNK